MIEIIKKHFKKIVIAILGIFTLTAAAATTLMVPQGGTGASTLTGVVVGNGTGAFTTNSTGALASDLNIDSDTFVISYDDNKVGLGTTTPAYKLDVVGSIQTDTAFRGDYWISATGNSMYVQPTGDTDDFFSFKTPADRPTIKREGGKYIYIESSNVNDVGISFRKDADHSGTVNYYKDTIEFGLTSKDPVVFKSCDDYDDYIKICTATDVPEMSIVGAADFKINAGGANNLLLNHSGGNVAVGATSTGYILGLGTGDTFGIGTTQWSSADEIDGTKIKDADYGDVVIDAAGDWQVSEATALAANGANCSAGQYPLGVDTLGAVESCTNVNTVWLTNKSGASLAANDTVVIDNSNANAVTTTTTAGNELAIGVIKTGGVADAQVEVQIAGIVNVKIAGVVASSGYFLRTATTAKYVYASGTSGTAGDFLISLSGGGAGSTIPAMFKKAEIY